MSQTCVFDILAMSAARLAPSELSEIRRRSLPCFAGSLSPHLLKHSDEQTLASLAALAGALEDLGVANRDFGDWAVVSSSRYLGRSAFAGVLAKYDMEGPWGVSVQVIPHCVAHAVSGTISLALGNHGPCIGAGGAPSGEIDALMAAAGLLTSGQCPAAWVVFSAWLPELTINRGGRPTSEPICSAAALAIAPHSSSANLGKIRIGEFSVESFPPTLGLPEPCLNLTEFLTGQTSTSHTWHQSAGGKVHCEINLIPRLMHDPTVRDSDKAPSLAAGGSERR